MMAYKTMLSEKITLTSLTLCTLRFLLPSDFLWLFHHSLSHKAGLSRFFSKCQRLTLREMELSARAVSESTEPDSEPVPIPLLFHSFLSTLIEKVILDGNFIIWPTL